MFQLMFKSYLLFLVPVSCLNWKFPVRLSTEQGDNFWTKSKRKNCTVTPRPLDHITNFDWLCKTDTKNPCIVLSDEYLENPCSPWNTILELEHSKLGAINVENCPVFLCPTRRNHTRSDVSYHFTHNAAVTQSFFFMQLPFPLLRLRQQDTQPTTTYHQPKFKLFHCILG